jgi:hypothetical protein
MNWEARALLPSNERRVLHEPPLSLLLLLDEDSYKL